MPSHGRPLARACFRLGAAGGGCVFPFDVTSPASAMLVDHRIHHIAAIETAPTLESYRVGPNGNVLFLDHCAITAHALHEVPPAGLPYEGEWLAERPGESWSTGN